MLANPMQDAAFAYQDLPTKASDLFELGPQEMMIQVPEYYKDRTPKQRGLRIQFGAVEKREPMGAILNMGRLIEKLILLAVNKQGFSAETKFSRNSLIESIRHVISVHREKRFLQKVGLTKILTLKQYERLETIYPSHDDVGFRIYPGHMPEPKPISEKNYHLPQPSEPINGLPRIKEIAW